MFDRQIDMMQSRIVEGRGVHLKPKELGAITELADRLEGWLALEPQRRHEAGLRLAERVDDLWSWEGVARTVVAASRGQLGDLPRVGTPNAP